VEGAHRGLQEEHGAAQHLRASEAEGRLAKDKERLDRQLAAAQRRLQEADKQLAQQAQELKALQKAHQSLVTPARRRSRMAMSSCVRSTSEVGQRMEPKSRS